ncbi:hypothetical protein HID58_052570 [Brassica napus]|uniref:Uncharacterized protein n=1 Tax=Brassica napus TaxID=3708 RepID=A0ABQ8AC72_BRANA|nr:hypothetical protein HID58_052570 [Brassica napus]
MKDVENYASNLEDLWAAQRYNTNEKASNSYVSWNLQTVLKHHFWNFVDWVMVIERWQEFPSHPTSVNSDSQNTVLDGGGYTKKIRYDPDQHMLKEYVRATHIGHPSTEYGKNASTAYASRMRSNDVPFSKATKTREMVWQRGGMEMEVWEQMKLYMNCTNPEERRIRNTVAQSSYVPTITRFTSDLQAS